jgi:lysophospholipid acyltransferase (LPLAT)-like uncharacterized protein
MKKLVRHPLVQAALARLLGFYLDFALRTTTWTVDGQNELEALAGGCPAVVAFWHEYLPLIPALKLMARKSGHYRPTPVDVLVSHHNDGRFIGLVVRRFGVTTVLGSSSRGGSEAVRNLLARLRDGHLILITPDGPRGPRREAAPGVAQLAALSGAPVLPVAARTTRCIRLGSWDRMSIPLPFGRGVMVCGGAIPVPRATWAEVLPTVAAALNTVADRADRLCPA